MSKVESFHVKKAKESVNYELDLPKNARIFLVFHISLLESVDPSTSIQKTFHYKAQKESRYEVERILRQQGDDPTRAFAAGQLKNLGASDSFIPDNRHCVFRFAFASIFFKIFLFRSNRVMTIVSRALSSAILTKRSSLL